HQIYELRWDEHKKHLKTINPNQPEIWSSATLYNKEAAELRRNWFFSWMEKHKDAVDFKIADFHNKRHGNSIENDILMKRDDGLETISLSQIMVEAGDCRFNYKDMKNPKFYSRVI
nr:hypothetical protein [Bacteroidota bacterium]